MQKYVLKHIGRGAEWRQKGGVGAAATSGQRADNERRTSEERFQNFPPPLIYVKRSFSFCLTFAPPFSLRL